MCIEAWRMLGFIWEFQRGVCPTADPLTFLNFLLTVLLLIPL